MNKELFFLGEPFPFKKGIKIYPPTVRDVVANPGYGLYVRILTQSQEEIEDEYVEKKIDLKDMLTPLETLLALAY